MALGNRISVFFHLVLSIFLCTMMIEARPARFDSTALLISPASIIQGEKFRVLLVLEQSQKNITLDGINGRGAEDHSGGMRSLRQDLPGTIRFYIRLAKLHPKNICFP